MAPIEDVAFKERENTVSLGSLLGHAAVRVQDVGDSADGLHELVQLEGLSLGGALFGIGLSPLFCLGSRPLDRLIAGLKDLRNLFIGYVPIEITYLA